MELLKRHWWQFLLMGAGFILIVIGLVLAQKETRGEAVVILGPSPSSIATMVQLVVDIEGSVEKPGIYRLPEGSRVGEVIVLAGGLSVKADRSYVARFINQAEAVRDGMKVYIPEVGEALNAEMTNNKYQMTNQNGMISINTASEEELDSLWGVGEARAKMIIENRPYTSLDELVTKAKLTQDVIDKNQGKIGL